MNTQKALFVSLGCVLATACADNLKVPETNVTPVAVARVLDDDRLMPSFSFSGAAIELTLDGSNSHDPDGSIRSHRWLSATRPSDVAQSGGDVAIIEADAGSTEDNPGRWVPEGEPADWPEDIARPSVRLPAPGLYSFAAWVTDDRGWISDPVTLTIEVLNPE